MLNKAHELMKQREEMIREAKQVLATLQATEDKMMYTAPMTNITINKGKIIEVQVTKEIVVDNTNEEYIEQLLRDLQNRNERIEQLKKQLEKEQQDYRDLEVQDLEELEYADKEIKQLREELHGKELLLNDFREAMDKAIKEKQSMSNEIKLHNDTIEELKMQIDIQKEELEYYHSKEKEYEEDVEGMEMDNEALKLQMEGMKFAYENEIASLKSQVSKLTAQLFCIETEVFEEEEEEEEVVPVVEQPETTDWYSFMSIPEELKDNEYVNNMYKSCGDMYNNPVETRLRQRVIRTKEQCMEKQIADFNEVVAKALEEQKKLDKYNLSLNRVENKKTNAYTSVYGKITLNGVEYAYKYDATFEYPVVYGCMDMNLIKEAASVLIPKAQFTLSDDEYQNRHKHAVTYDFANNLVVWVSDDGVFKGYTDKYAFVWDPKQAVPCGIPNLRAMDSFKRYKKMNTQCWSKGPAEIGQSIMKYCRKMMEETKAVSKATKEIVTQVTNDEDDLPDELDTMVW